MFSDLIDPWGGAFNLTEEPKWTALSRGFTTQIINNARMYEPSPNILKSGATKHSGLSFVALSRSASRLKNQPGCIYAKANRDGSARLLQLVVRQAKRDTPMHYPDRDAGFDQDLIHYALLSLYISTNELTQLSAVFSRHAIQRWIERGGAGDPRVDLIGKLDRAALRMLIRGNLFDVSETIRWSNLRDQFGESARFGIPTSDGGMWVSGTAESRSSLAPAVGQQVTFRSTSVFLITYLSPDQLSERQRGYREVAVSGGILQAVKQWPSMFSQPG